MRLLISMREREEEDALEKNYVRFFQERGFCIVPVTNNENAIDDLLREADGMVFTGGGDIGEQKNRDKVEGKMLDYAYDNDVPVLGICRGMQFINHHLNGDLQRVKNHIRSKHRVYVNTIFKEKSYIVNSFHEYAINRIGEGLSVFAVTYRGTIEGIYNDLIIAVQWHPERESVVTELDENIINLFKDRIKERK